MERGYQELGNNKSAIEVEKSEGRMRRQIM